MTHSNSHQNPNQDPNSKITPISADLSLTPSTLLDPKEPSIFYKLFVSIGSIVVALLFCAAFIFAVYWFKDGPGKPTPPRPTLLGMKYPVLQYNGVTRTSPDLRVTATNLIYHTSFGNRVLMAVQLEITSTAQHPIQVEPNGYLVLSPNPTMNRQGEEQALSINELHSNSFDDAINAKAPTLLTTTIHPGETISGWITFSFIRNFVIYDVNGLHLQLTPGDGFDYTVSFNETDPNATPSQNP